MGDRSDAKEAKGMSPLMIEKIDRVLERVKDPESGLPVSRLGLVKRFRYSEREKKSSSSPTSTRTCPNASPAPRLPGRSSPPSFGT